MIYVGLVFHHSCFDGRSMEIFRREFVQLISGRNPAKPAPSAATYADYAITRAPVMVIKGMAT